MSKKTGDQTGGHPYIASLIRKMDLVTDLLVRQDYKPFIQGMRAIFLGLKPEDKVSPEGKALNKEIMGAIIARRRVRDADPVVLQTKLMGFDSNFEDGYYNIYDLLSTLLWNGGYYSDEAYGFFDPSGGRKSGR